MGARAEGAAASTTQVKSSPGPDGAPAAEWGEFLHLKGQRFHDDEKIREEIQSETNRLTGTNRGISDRPIRLKITSPHVLCAPLSPSLHRPASLPPHPAPAQSQSRAQPSCSTLDRRNHT